MIKYKKESGLLFGFGLVFCAISLTFFVSILINSTLWYCFRHYETTHFLSKFFVDTSYIFQSYLLWLLLFIRLVFVFKDTVHELSPVLKRSATFMFIIGAIILIGLSLAYTFTNPFDIEWKISLISLCIFSSSISVYLSFLFIYKLVQVFKGMEQTRFMPKRSGIDDPLLNPIAKNTILTLFSVPFTALIFVSALPGVAGKDDFYVYSYVFLLDGFSNFICIMYSYDIFERYYKCCCSCIDKKCKTICFKINATKVESEFEIKHDYQLLDI